MSFVSGGELLLSVSGGELLHWHTVPLLSRGRSELSFSPTSQAQRSILDNLETSFSRTSQANLCPEFYRPVRSSAYAKPMPMRTQKLVSSVTVLARGAMARPAPRARSARAADGGLGSRAAGHGVAGVAHGHAVAAAHAVAVAAHGVAGVVAAVAAVGAAYGT